jgi:hypothetical protein
MVTATSRKQKWKLIGHKFRTSCQSPPKSCTVGDKMKQKCEEHSLDVEIFYIFNHSCPFLMVEYV